MTHFKKLFRPLSEGGMAHFVVPLLVIAVVAVVGGFIYERVSHAATPANAVYFRSGLPGKCMDVWHSGSADGTKVDLYGCNDSPAQQWTIKQAGAYAMIVNANGACLDVWQAKKADNTPIAVYKCSALDSAQLWKVNGNQLYNQWSNKCLDDPSGSTADGTQLIIYACNHQSNQQWGRIAVTSSKVPTPTTTAPSITNVAATATTSTTTITWSTNQNASSQVKYDTTSGAYGKSVSSTTQTTSHSVQLTGLAANTLYYYEVLSTNATGKTTTSSGHTVTTSKSGTTGGGVTTGGGTAFGGCSATVSKDFTTYSGFNIQTNEWSSGAPFAICNSKNGPNFQITTSGISQSGGAPGSYPSIYIGDHWGTKTSNDPLPIAASAMETNGASTGKVTSSYNTTTIGSGAWDDAYDIWFNSAANATANNTGLEMMVWLNHIGGVQPAGSVVADNVSIGGISYNIWWNGSSTVSYVMTSPTSSVTNLNLGALAANAVSRGYMKDNWYLNDVEAGFEVWTGGVGLTANDFSVTVH